MTKRAPDRWLSAWDEYGESIDTNRTVQVTVGILAPKHDPAVAISVAGETPVTLTHDAVARLREHLDWAVAEHQQLVLRADQAADTGAQYKQIAQRCQEPAPDNDGSGRPAEAVTTEVQRKAQREALALIEAKRPTDRIDYALFYLQASVGYFLVGRDTKNELAWHHEVAQELANLTDEEIAESKQSKGRQ